MVIGDWWGEAPERPFSLIKRVSSHPEIMSATPINPPSRWSTRTMARQRFGIGRIVVRIFPLPCDRHQAFPEPRPTNYPQLRFLPPSYMCPK